MVDTDDLLFHEEIHRIVGCAIEVSKILGRSLQDRVYENALVVELRLQRIPLQQQPKFEVVYKDVTVGRYIPGLVCFEQIIVDTKMIDAITDHEREQVLNYLKISGLQVGLVLNFKHEELQWERVVLSRC